MWWLYFRWQWLRDPFGNHTGLQRMLATLFLLLGGLGGYVHWKRDWRSFSYFGPLMLTVTFALIYYMNFKYGASQAGDLGDYADYYLASSYFQAGRSSEAMASLSDFATRYPESLLLRDARVL